MIQHILYPVAIGLLFAEFSGIPQKVSRWLATKDIYGKRIPNPLGYGPPSIIPARLKPFDCGMCLSFWIAVTQNYCLHYTVYDIFALAAASGCVAYITVKLITRLT